MNETADIFWLEVMLTVIGALAMLILSGVLWFIRKLHLDVEELDKTFKQWSELLRKDLNETADKVQIRSESSVKQRIPTLPRSWYRSSIVLPNPLTEMDTYA